MAEDNQESYLATSHVISLIAKLLDSRKNPFADQFNKVFATWKLEMIKKSLIKPDGHWRNDACLILQHYIMYQNLKGTKVHIDQLLDDEQQISNYQEWIELNSGQTKSISDINKSSKSVLIQDKPEDPLFFKTRGSGQSKDLEDSPGKISQGINFTETDLAKSLSVYGSGDSEGKLEEDMNMPDLSNLPTMKKTKSFTMKAINDDLKGKNKRFSVMKLITDEARERADELAKSIVESVFLENDQTPGESIFAVPEGMKCISQDIVVKPEIVSMKHYIFTTQVCRNCTLDFDEKEQTMRIIEKTDDVEIIQIRRKFMKKQPEVSEQGESSHKQRSGKDGASVSKSTESNASAEIGGQNKIWNKIYYIRRIQNEDNIYIVFLQYDQKSSTIIENNYIVIAVGEKNNIDNYDQWWIEIAYMYSQGQEENEESTGESVSKILREIVEHTNS